MSNTTWVAFSQGDQIGIGLSTSFSVLSFLFITPLFYLLQSDRHTRRKYDYWWMMVFSCDLAWQLVMIPSELIYAFQGGRSTSCSLESTLVPGATMMVLLMISLLLLERYRKIIFGLSTSYNVVLVPLVIQLVLWSMAWYDASMMYDINPVLSWTCSPGSGGITLLTLELGICSMSCITCILVLRRYRSFLPVLTKKQRHEYHLCDMLVLQYLLFLYIQILPLIPMSSPVLQWLRWLAIKFRPSLSLLVYIYQDNRYYFTCCLQSTSSVAPLPEPTLRRYRSSLRIIIDKDSSITPTPVTATTTTTTITSSSEVAPLTKPLSLSPIHQLVNPPKGTFLTPTYQQTKRHRERMAKMQKRTSLPAPLRLEVDVKEKEKQRDESSH